MKRSYEDQQQNRILLAWLGMKADGLKSERWWNWRVIVLDRPIRFNQPSDLAEDPLLWTNRRINHYRSFLWPPSFIPSQAKSIRFCCWSTYHRLIVFLIICDVNNGHFSVRPDNFGLWSSIFTWPIRTKLSLSLNRFNYFVDYKKLMIIG